MTKAKKPLGPLLPHHCHMVCLQLPEQVPLASQSLPWVLASLSPWQLAAATAPPNREHTMALPGTMAISAAPLRTDAAMLKPAPGPHCGLTQMIRNPQGVGAA